MNKLHLRFLIVLIFISPFLLSSSCKSEPDIRVEEQPQQKVENAVIIDVRTPQEFESGAIDGAVNIPLSELGNRLDEVREFDQIIVYCASGARSSQAKVIVENAGFKNVSNGGGIQQLKQKLK